MSRAALWRQDGNAKERELRAEEIFRCACEEGRRKSSSALPLWGDDTSFHFNPMLLRNCIDSPYFQKCCENLKDWNAVIDEIFYEVKNLQVFQVGKQPSTAFSLLLRLLTLRMTRHQLELTLNHTDSPCIRGIGFLYLRFAGIPEEVYQWIEPYLHDEEEFTVERAEQRDAKKITMGAFVRLLFQSRDYYGQTTLPRLPVQVERDLAVKLLAADKIAERAAQHCKNSARMEFFQKLGSEVMALYGDEENPVTWYKAVVDRVIHRDDKGSLLKYPRFVVTFLEYGNTETVTLGEMDVVGGAASSGKDSGGRGGSHGGGRGNADLYEEVRRREREQVAASSRGSWSRRPPSTKESLSSHHPYHQRASNDSERVHVRRDEHQRDTSQRDHYQHRPKLPPDSTAAAPAGRPPAAAAVGSLKKRTAEELATIADKKRKLMAKYG